MTTAEAVAEAKPEAESPIIIRQDTCDRCGPGVLAFVGVTMPSGKTLTFCGHHGALWRAAIIEQGGEILDLTHMVTEG